jgi:2-amino-4-hydroxy-6-hydroxymethyldihydropteridine diphosphokinase
MPRCLIALGANLGDRERSLQRAVELLGAERQISLVACSRWHETAPVGGAPNQGPFLNGVLCLDTDLTAEQLRDALGRIEARLGRIRARRWDARLIDLDLLLYGNLVIATPTLVVPHPRMAFRRFVLEPAAEAAPEMVHPTIGWSIGQLLAHLNTALPYVALMGPPGCGKTSLARSLAGRFGGRFIADPAMPWPPSGLANPPSHVYERQIQFLDRRTNALDARNWQQSDVLAVSDFYFDQSLAYAQTELAARDYEAFCRAWAAAGAHVIRPKLLVVLDAPPGDTAEQPATESAHAGRLRRELLGVAARSGTGPVLYASGGDEQAQFDEISAAIAAVQ